MLDQIKGLDEEDVAKVVESVVRRESQSIDLCRSLIQGRSWRDIRGILATMKDDPEKVRRSVLGYATKVLLSPNSNSAEQAFLVIQCFENSFFNSGMAGLVAACYDVATDKDRK